MLEMEERRILGKALIVTALFMERYGSGEVYTS
jgi:hypothetical protein